MLPKVRIWVVVPNSALIACRRKSLTYLLSGSCPGRPGEISVARQAMFLPSRCPSLLGSVYTPKFL